jgi:hypothetical protein
VREGAIRLAGERQSKGIPALKYGGEKKFTHSIERDKNLQRVGMSDIGTRANVATLFGLFFVAGWKRHKEGPG